MPACVHICTCALYSAGPIKATHKRTLIGRKVNGILSLLPLDPFDIDIVTRRRVLGSVWGACRENVDAQTIPLDAQWEPPAALQPGLFVAGNRWWFSSDD